MNFQNTKQTLPNSTKALKKYRLLTLHKYSHDSRLKGHHSLIILLFLSISAKEDVHLKEAMQKDVKQVQTVPSELWLANSIFTTNKIHSE